MRPRGRALSWYCVPLDNLARLALEHCGKQENGSRLCTELRHEAATACGRPPLMPDVMHAKPVLATTAEADAWND